MKFTFLIKTTNENGEQILAEISAKEWFEIIENNRNLKGSQRRYFSQDEFDGDCMYIEIPYDEYRKWNNKQTKANRNRTEKKKYRHVSLDGAIDDADSITLADTIADPRNFEDDVISNIRMRELQAALMLWQPWAIDIYNAYMEGRKRECTAEIAKKYGVSEATVRSYKRRFENFVIFFLN